jgi:hypothetical protein
MNSERAFLAPFEKTERAKTQIQDLKIAIKSFFESVSYQVVREVDPEAIEEIWGFQITTKIPGALSIMAGEILHNLRSALDQLAAELAVRIAKRTESKVEFPFGRDFNEFETALRKQKKLPLAALPLIRALKPYKGGDPLLWLLHSANRTDKHRMGLVPIQLRSSWKMSYLTLRYGQALVIGSRKGQHLCVENRLSNEDYGRLAVQDRAWGIYGTMKQDPRTGRPLGPTLGPAIISDAALPKTSEESMPFLTTTPGTKFETDFQPSFDVAFREIWGLEREPIVHVFGRLRDLVERILLTFEKRFFR